MSNEGLYNSLSLPRILVSKKSGMKYQLGDKVRKIKGSEWSGTVVGFYSTAQTRYGYCVESKYHANTVQIYPESALEFDV